MSKYMKPINLLIAKGIFAKLESNGTKYISFPELKLIEESAIQFIQSKGKEELVKELQEFEEQAATNEEVHAFEYLFEHPEKLVVEINHVTINMKKSILTLDILSKVQMEDGKYEYVVYYGAIDVPFSYIIKNHKEAFDFIMKLANKVLAKYDATNYFSFYILDERYLDELRERSAMDELDDDFYAVRINNSFNRYAFWEMFGVKN